MAKRAFYQGQKPKKAAYSSIYNQAAGNPTINPFALQPFQYGEPTLPAIGGPVYVPAQAPQTPPVVTYTPPQTQKPAHTMPWQLQGSAGSASIYSAPAATTTTGSNPNPVQYNGWQAAVDQQGNTIPWASTNEYARYQQAVAGYKNSMGNYIPGIKGLSFLDWYYQLGGRIREGMQNAERQFIANRERPYQRLRARIARAEQGPSTPSNDNATNPGEGQTVRYTPNAPSWRI